jgi:tetratricopeptide (TPR) repeat protein
MTTLNQARAELGPEYAEIFCDRGIALDDKGEYDGAILVFDKAIDIRPDYAEAFAHRGIAYERLGEIKSALADYRRQYDLGSRPPWLIEKLKMHGMLS